VGLVADTGKREFKRILKASLRDTLNYWHKRIFPRHFGVSAFTNYPHVYKRRTRDFTKRKRRERGHEKPLVYTGRMHRELVVRRPQVLGTTGRTRVVMRGPAYTDIRGRIDKKAELTVVTRRDEREMAMFLEKVLLSRIASMKSRKTERV
jgi:hypothetical protein